MDTAHYDQELHEAARRFRDAPLGSPKLAHAYSRLFHAFAFAGYQGVNEASVLRAYVLAFNIRFQDGTEIKDTRRYKDIMMQQWRRACAESESLRCLNGEAQKRGWQRTLRYLPL